MERRWWAVLGLLLAVGAPARADNVNLTFTGVSSGAGTFHLNVAGSEKYVYASALHWHNNSVGSSLATDFTTFCVELNQFVTDTTTYAITAPSQVPLPGVGSPTPGLGMGPAKADLLSELWGTYRASATGAAGEAAFQIAVWEIVFEGPGSEGGPIVYDVNSGNFHTGSGNDSTQLGYAKQAQKWIDDILANGGPHADLVGLSSPTAQDQITAVPVPSSLLLLGMGGVGLAGNAWRRRRQAR